MRSRNCYVTDSHFKTINTNERVYNKLGCSYQEQRNYCWSPWLQRYQDKTQYLIKLDTLYRYDPIQFKVEKIGELRSSVAYRSNIIFATMNSETFCIDKQISWDLAKTDQRVQSVKEIQRGDKSDQVFKFICFEFRNGTLRCKCNKNRRRWHSSWFW